MIFMVHGTCKTYPHHTVEVERVAQLVIAETADRAMERVKRAIKRQAPVNAVVELTAQDVTRQVATWSEW